jgi:hypothetical protein
VSTGSPLKEEKSGSLAKHWQRPQSFGVLPALTAAWTLLPSLVPAVVFIGKAKHRGKNKRPPKPANHGSRPCSHVGRRQRAAARGRFKFNPKR